MLLDFSLAYNVEVITSHPPGFQNVERKEPKQLSPGTVKVAPIATLDLGNWGSYSLRTYVLEPLRCFTCQKDRHN